MLIMRTLTDISKERDDMSTMLEITSAFEGIASMRISQIKDLVKQSESFFDDLWRIYSQLRVDQSFRFGRQDSKKVIKKELLILITSEGSLSGDIDQRLVDEAAKHYVSEKNDILIVGHHGAVQLKQRGIPYVRDFKLPEHDRNINVTPIVVEVQKYASTTVYYESYISLTEQEVKSIQLGSAVTERGKNVVPGAEIITEINYIFEPSVYAVVSHLERSMIQITLSQVILESKLAQYASRFKAMSEAHTKVDDSLGDLVFLYNRVKRQAKDERLKEVINGLRGAES